MVNRRTFDSVESGELMLYVGNRSDYPFLCVYKELGAGLGTRVKVSFLEKGYLLKKGVEVDGVLQPVVVPHASINAQISLLREAIFGKEEIIEYCLENNLDVHVGWISGLRRPYENDFPRAETVTYIPANDA